MKKKTFFSKQNHIIIHAIHVKEIIVFTISLAKNYPVKPFLPLNFDSKCYPSWPKSLQQHHHQILEGEGVLLLAPTAWWKDLSALQFKFFTLPLFPFLYLRPATFPSTLHLLFAFFAHKPPLFSFPSNPFPTLRPLPVPNPSPSPSQLASEDGFFVIHRSTLLWFRCRRIYNRIMTSFIFLWKK